MHEIKLRVQALRSQAARVEPCHWSEGRHNNVGVSLRKMRATMQVMLEVSLRARWDQTLVSVMDKIQCHNLIVCRMHQI